MIVKEAENGQTDDQEIRGKNVFYAAFEGDKGNK